ncbi:hypothetical protein K438DRAFT_1774132 [Mycena galopus ATCC 62051]|nr:hypothetical protein K438DRAFT_1774132 [Mycena galopus ATCC 62051]
MYLPFPNESPMALRNILYLILDYSEQLCLKSLCTIETLRGSYWVGHTSFEAPPAPHASGLQPPGGYWWLTARSPIASVDPRFEAADDLSISEISQYRSFLGTALLSLALGLIYHTQIFPPSVCEPTGEIFLSVDNAAEWITSLADDMVVTLRFW